MANRPSAFEQRSDVHTYGILNDGARDVILNLALEIWLKFPLQSLWHPEEPRAKG
jgi:hypothetical protein